MNIYQHFRPEEKEFIDQVLSWKDSVELTYTPKLTDFLDPREQAIIKLLIGEHANVHCGFYGGHSGAERKRALLMPEYLDSHPDDFNICLFEVEYPSKFVTLEHPQVLGSLMSLGLKRSKFGDILFEGKRVQFFACEDVGNYCLAQVQLIGKAAVHLTQLGIENAIQSIDHWVEDEITVSSLRLDTTISGIHHLSRQKSQTIIQQGLVKVNWTLIENPSFDCREGDLISVRGFGRVKVISIDGRTKKEKWRITVGKQK